MPIDASIAQGVRPPEPIDPLQSAAKAYTLKSAMQQSQMGDFELQDNLTLRDAFKNPSIRNPDGSLNYETLLSETGGKVSPKTYMGLTTAAAADQEKKQKQAETKMRLNKELVEQAGPISASLYQRYEELSKTVGAEQAWQQVLPDVTAAQEKLAPMAKMAGHEVKPPSPEQLRMNAMSWGKYAEQQMRKTQPKTPHEVATEENQKKTGERLDRQQTETERHNKKAEGIASQRLAAAQSGGAKAPAGYRWNKDKPGELEAIPGGPATAKAKGNTIESRMQPTMLATVKLDMEELHYGLDAIGKLKTKTASPFFEDHDPGGFVSRFTKNKLSNVEQQKYDAYANRFAMAIASIQSMGRGQVSDTKMMEAKRLVPVPGDAEGTVEVKLQIIRRIAELAEKTLKTPIAGVAPAGAAAEEDESEDVDVDIDSLVEKYTKGRK